MMTRGLPDDDGALDVEAASASVLEASARGGALALGPGLGRGDGAVAFARDARPRGATWRWCSTPTG